MIEIKPPWYAMHPADLPVKVHDHFPDGIVGPPAFGRTDPAVHGRTCWYVLQSQRFKRWYVYDNRPSRWNGVLTKPDLTRRWFRDELVAMAAVDRIEHRSVE